MASSPFNYSRATPVAAPSFLPTEGGLLDAAQVVEVKAGDPRLRGYYFESHAGEVDLDDVTYDDLKAIEALPDAEGEDLDFVTSLDPFTMAKSFDLTFIAAGLEPLEQRVSDFIKHAEARKVERKVWAGALPTAAAANVLHGGAALKPIKAVGLALEWIADHFAGVPYLHAGRRVATEIAGAQLTVLPDDGMALAAIKGGGRLVNGAGYSAKTAIGAVTPTADQAWLFVSGTALLMRGPLTVTPEAPGYEVDRDRRTAFRTYVPSLDGAVAAVLVDLS